VAQRIALGLDCRGWPLNLELVRAGALLHDLAKGEHNHAAMGASLLRSMDFLRLATVVGAHTSFDFPGERLDESAIVYLADKLVSGEDAVTLEQRFAPALARFRDDPPALRAAQSRMAAAKAVALAVETRLAAPLSSVVSARPGAPESSPADEAARA
jgi:hypothetical protein